MALSRSLFLRALGAVYLSAFLSLQWQLMGLFGSEGIAPIADLLERNAAALGYFDFFRFPTLWWVDASDSTLRAGCWSGVGLSLFLIAGIAPKVCLLLLWCLYLSFVTTGAPFMNYQWDSLLLETGFLAMLWAPLKVRLGKATEQPSPLFLWGLRWLLFRLMFFSGWVKLASGDPTWWDLSALGYHYETQPLPTWTSWYVDQLPRWFQSFTVALMFVIELVVPWLMVCGRRARALCALCLVGLQILIAATGNYGFFNLLTIVLCLTLLDDRQLLRLVPARFRPKPSRRPSRPIGAPRLLIQSSFLALLVALSLPAAAARIHPAGQTLEEVFRPLRRALAPFHLTSQYGLFAVMTTNRPELILEGSSDGRTWKPYVFRYKPGPLDRRPSFVAPDMPRLDWQMWFDALYAERALQRGRPIGGRVITPRLLQRLREGSPSVLGLLGPNPFASAPPLHVRWRLYDYRFTDRVEHRKTGAWWDRRPLRATPRTSFRLDDSTRDT